jgi:DNA-binding response OmpR family regulator
VVDDDRDLGDLVVAILRAEGHVVRIARNGHDGLRRMEERLPELVLLDVEMPQLSGTEVVYRMLVRDLGMERIPIVLLSGVVRLRDLAASVGTPYYLAKPFSRRSLVALVAQALAERQPPRPTLEMA